MNRYNEIIKNNDFEKYLNRLNELEKDREFCRHDIEHFLSLARIAYIHVLEQNLAYSKDVVYAIALLHDLGRVLEYENGTPHEKGSGIIAKEILKYTTYSQDEVIKILGAIESHRGISEETDLLNSIIKKSDKLSRNCFCCMAEKDCYWSSEKKNFEILY
ncbi:MAG: HD domain-containing protein [Clostridium sp.]